MINLSDYLLESENLLNTEIDYILDNEFINDSINESGGVAAFPVVKDIVKIYNQLNNYIKDENVGPENSNDKISFSLKTPLFKTIKEIDANVHTIRIKFNDSNYSFKELMDLPNSVILITIYDLQTDDKFIETYINTSNLKSDYISNVKDFSINKSVIKANVDTIRLNVYAINGKIIPEMFYSSFIHEFNHLFQDYSQLIKNSKREFIKGKQYLKSIDFINDIDDILTEKQQQILQDIFYVLFNDTEINSFASTIFGELMGKNIKATNYSNFLSQSKVWKLVDSLNRKIKYILSLEDDEFYNIMLAFKYSRISRIFFDIYSISAFRKKLAEELTKRLNKLINSINKVAGYYFSTNIAFECSGNYNIPHPKLWESYGLKLN